jgi:hypothetical protein
VSPIVMASLYSCDGPLSVILAQPPPVSAPPSDTRVSPIGTFRVAKVCFLPIENRFFFELNNRDENNKSHKKEDGFTHTHILGG